MEINYQLLFILNFIVCYFSMKALSWTFTPHNNRPGLLSFFFGCPYISTQSLRITPPPPSSSPWLSLLLHLGIMSLIFSSVKIFLTPIGYLDRILLGFGIYFFTEALGSLGQALYVTRRPPVFPIHHFPLSSPTLGQFWSRRWNLWVQDWISDLGRPFRRRPRMKIVVSFLISGLFHEVMVNFPHWLLSGESYFGTMLSYFLIQSIGLFADKRFLQGASPLFRRLFCWIVVVAPSPLFINVPVLRFFGVTE